MAMLAGPKRKSKYGSNPNGTDWSQDDNKFGQRLLERMGWNKGNGLGSNQDGMVDPIAVKYKSPDDVKGVGCSAKHADNWIAHQDDFNSLLSTLQENHSGSGSNTPSTEDKVASLEAKSKGSKGRVHYHKFTRGKDLSAAKEKDLDSILGKRKKKKEETSQIEEDKEEESGESTPVDNSNVLHTVSGLSVQEYFAQKMAAIQKARESAQKRAPVENSDGGNSEEEIWQDCRDSGLLTDDDSLLTNDRSANEKDSDNFVSCDDDEGKIPDKKPKNKKLKKTAEDKSDSDFKSSQVIESCDGGKKSKKSKKSKKLKLENSEEDENKTVELSSEVVVNKTEDSPELCDVATKKKKSKKSKKQKSETPDSDNTVENSQLEVERDSAVVETKTKKKSKKDKSLISEDADSTPKKLKKSNKTLDSDNTVENSQLDVESDSVDVETKTKKKLKKDKSLISEDVVNVVADSTPKKLKKSKKPKIEVELDVSVIEVTKKKKKKVKVVDLTSEADDKQKLASEDTDVKTKKKKKKTKKDGEDAVAMETETVSDEVAAKKKSKKKKRKLEEEDEEVTTESKKIKKSKEETSKGIEEPEDTDPYTRMRNRLQQLKNTKNIERKMELDNKRKNLYQKKLDVRIKEIDELRRERDRKIQERKKTVQNLKKLIFDLPKSKETKLNELKEKIMFKSRQVVNAVPVRKCELSFPGVDLRLLDGYGGNKYETAISKSNRWDGPKQWWTEKCEKTKPRLVSKAKPLPAKINAVRKKKLLSNKKV